MTTGFMPILLVCVGGGVVFAVLAFFTARYAATALAKGGDPTKIQINNAVTISTGNAVVALFILAVIVAAGVPGVILYLDRGREDGTIALEFELQPAVGSLQIVPLNDSGSSYIPKIDVFRSRIPQHFKITPTPEYNSVDVAASYDWLNKNLRVKVDEQLFLVPVQEVAATLGTPIALKHALISGVQSAKSVKLSQATRISPAALALPDPVGVPRQ